MLRGDEPTPRHAPAEGVAARALPTAVGQLAPPSVARECLAAGRVEVSPSAPFTVSWWSAVGKGGMVAARAQTDGGPGDIDNPHASHTLASLGAELRWTRERPSPKGSGWALCGASFRVGGDDAPAFFRRARAVRGVALLHVDVDPPKGADAGPARRELPTLRDFRHLCDVLSLGAVMHPSASAREGGLAATRVRLLLRVASAGSVEVYPSADPGDLADAHACVASMVAAALGADVDAPKASPESVAYTNASHAAACGGVEVREGAYALDPRAVRDAAIAAGVWSPYLRRRPRARDLDAVRALLSRVDELLPGTVGAVAHGSIPLRCPLAHTHSDGRGRGDRGDTSAALAADGWCGCSHSHGGKGPLSLAGMVNAWCELLPEHAAELQRLLSAAGAPRAAELLREQHAGAAGDTSDPRVSWELTHEGGAVHTLASITESSADVMEVLRRASVAWDAGDRSARLYLGATGTGKSHALGEALAALSPALPGDLDDRPDTPRALGVVACETREAVSATAARIDRAGADLVALRRGRHGAALRAAQYVPLSRVAAGGGPIEGDNDARECPHHATAARLEERGISARTSLCMSAGTDDPAELGAYASKPAPCPRLDACPAAQRFFYADGTSPATGDAYIAVLTGGAAPVAPPVVRGGFHLIDEAAKLTERTPITVRVDTTADVDAGDALCKVLPGDSPAKRDAGSRPRDSVRAVFAGMLNLLRDAAAGGGMLNLLQTPPERRVEVCAEHLTRWSETDASEGARTAKQAWGTLGGGVREAMERWQREAPVVRRWQRREARDAGAKLWRALQAWLDGAEVTANTHPARGAEGYRDTPMPGAVIHVPHPCAAAARRWITQGPVIALDATVDPSLYASALRAGDAGSTVRGIVARAVTVGDACEVRRVLCCTNAASASRLTDHRGRVAWRSPKGAAAAAVVTAALREVLRAGPRRDGTTKGDGPLAPAVVFAPRTLALTLAALAADLSPAAIREGAEVPGVAFAAGPAAAQRVALAESVEAAPAEVRAVVRDLAARCEVWWSYPGSTFARGSNTPHNAGARTVVALGDGMRPPSVARARATFARREGDDAATEQLRRDAAESLAQLFGRVRVRALRDGAVLLLHVGAVRSLDWSPDTIEATDLARLQRPTVDVTIGSVELPGLPTLGVTTPVEVSQRADLPAPLAAALRAGWTQTAIAGLCSVDARTVRRWCVGASTPRAEALEPLARALADVSERTRAAYRAMVTGLYRGRTWRELLHGTAKVYGITAASRVLAGDYARTGATPPPGVRALSPLDLDADALRRWCEHGGDLPPDVVATLAEIAPTMHRAWCGGAAAERAAKAEQTAPLAERARVSGAAGRTAPALGAPERAALDRIARALDTAPSAEQLAADLRGALTPSVEQLAAAGAGRTGTEAG